MDKFLNNNKKNTPEDDFIIEVTVPKQPTPATHPSLDINQKNSIIDTPIDLPVEEPLKPSFPNKEFFYGRSFGPPANSRDYTPNGILPDAENEKKSENTIKRPLDKPEIRVQAQGYREDSTAKNATKPPKKNPVVKSPESMLKLYKKSSSVDTPMILAASQSEAPMPANKKPVLSLSSPAQVSPEKTNGCSPSQSKNSTLTINFIEKSSDPEYSVFAFCGSITHTQQKILENFFNGCAQQENLHILCDLAGVSLMSSSGWGTLVAHHHRLKRLGGNLFLCGMKDSVLDSFQLLELNKLFSVYQTVSDCKNFIIEGSFHTRNSIHPQASPNPDIPDASISFEEKISRIISENPFGGTLKILKRLRSNDYGKTEIGLRQLISKLRAMDLDSKEKRYRFFRSL
jgi:anti-anti-sigma factor